MENRMFNRMGIKRFSSFPKTLQQAKEFLSAKGMEVPESDEEMLKAVVVKVNSKETLSPEEKSFIHAVVDLGDTCGCDSDHRIRVAPLDGRRIGYSET